MRKVCLMVVLLVVSTAPVAAQVPTQGMCDTKKSQATTERSLASTKYSEYVALADAAATSAGLAQAEFTAKWNQISPADRLLITGYLDYVATKLSSAHYGDAADGNSYWNTSTSNMTNGNTSYDASNWPAAYGYYNTSYSSAQWAYYHYLNAKNKAQDAQEAASDAQGILNNYP